MKVNRQSDLTGIYSGGVPSNYTRPITTNDPTYTGPITTLITEPSTYVFWVPTAFFNADEADEDAGKIGIQYGFFKNKTVVSAIFEDFIALTAVQHNGSIGYSLRVGGGLSKEPHLAVRLDAFILPEQAVRVARAAAEIFRDQQGLRTNRSRARLKYLFLKEGWTAESFLAELQSRLDFKLLPGVPEQVPDDIFRDHAGIHP
jgi:hypothetical protein